MKLITRYLLKELLLPFLLGLLLFTFLILFGQIFELTDYVVNKGLPLLDVILFVVMGVPESLPFTVPMAIILAVLMAYGRLAADNELTVLRASGYPLSSLVLPPLVVGLCLAVGVLGLKQFVLPELARQRNQRLLQMKQLNPVGLLQPKSTLKLGSYTLYAEEVDGKQLGGVEIIDHNYQPPLQIVSRKGRWSKTSDNAYRLLLFDGQINQRGEEDSYRVLNFQRHVVRFQLEEVGEEQLEPDQQRPSRLWSKYRRTYRKWRQLSERRNNDNRGADPGNLRQLEEKLRERGMYFHQALAYSFASFFLILIAAPLGMLAKQSGKSIGLGMSLVIILLYYLLKTTGEQLALGGWLPPSLAMWSPNLLFGIVGVGIFALLVWRGR